MTQLEVCWAGEPLVLLADKAVFWPKTRTLIIADPHFGKASAFRRAGIPVPEMVTATDLKRLDQALSATRSERLIVLGDFLHAPTGRTEATMAALEKWCRDHAQLERVVIAGNHDLKSGPLPRAWQIDAIDAELCEKPFCFRHEPKPRAGRWVLAGHYHPALAGSVAGQSWEKIPCFWFAKRVGVLPAFGSFTGTHPVRAVKGDLVVATTGEELMEIPQILLPARRR